MVWLHPPLRHTTRGASGSAISGDDGLGDLTALVSSERGDDFFVGFDNDQELPLPSPPLGAATATTAAGGGAAPAAAEAAESEASD